MDELQIKFNAIETEQPDKILELLRKWIRNEASNFSMTSPKPTLINKILYFYFN
jgi:hypothetical protein